MDNATKIRLIALHHEALSSDEVFLIKDLKIKYSKQWLQSQGDYPVFINSCLEKWIESQPDIVFNIATYNIE
jgi:hypothetical protein